MAAEWRVTIPDGTKGTVERWADNGQLIVRLDEPPRFRLWFWPEDLATVDGKPLPLGFAAGLPVREAGGS